MQKRRAAGTAWRAATAPLGVGLVAPVAEDISDADDRIADVDGDAVPPTATVTLTCRKSATALAWALDGGVGRLGAGHPLRSAASKLVDGVDRGADGIGGPTRGNAEPSETVLGSERGDFCVVRGGRKGLDGEDEMSGNLRGADIAP